MPLNDSAEAPEPQPALIPALIADGRPLLALTAMGLIVSGIFALFLAATVTFLPQDIAFLGMDTQTLAGLHHQRIVHFMFHDRVSFGGTLIAVGTLYLWLLTFPLGHGSRLGEEWAWWTLLFSGSVGFASFFCCFVYHYIDTWHLTASLALLALYIVGMQRTRSLLPAAHQGWRSLLRDPASLPWRTHAGFGRGLMLFVTLGMLLAGVVIMLLGSTVVFVPQDIAYFGYTHAQLDALNPHLVPLIAHDRAGFGGGLASCGLCVFFIVLKARIDRALWQALLFAGLTGFGCAIGIHYPMHYFSPSHLAPAWIGAMAYLAGIVCLRPAKSD